MSYRYHKASFCLSFSTHVYTSVHVHVHQLSYTVCLCLQVQYNMKGREVKWANPKLGMRNCIKSRVDPLANMSFFGLGEFSLCPETHFKGIFNFNGG